MVAAIVALAFGLGIVVGTHTSRRPVETLVTSSPMQSDPVSPMQSDPVNSPVPGRNPPPCVDIRNVTPLVGKNGCVSGLILRVYSARTGNTFLDFCSDYRTCPFTTIIFAADKGKFGDLETLQGRRVEIRGDIVTYQGHAEIVVHDPRQVQSAQ